MKRKMKLSRNFTFPTMLQYVAWLSFSVFGGSLKIENWKRFLFLTIQTVGRTTQEGEGGVHSHVNFCPSHPPPRSPFLHGNFFCPFPPPSPPTLHFSEEEEAGSSYLPRSHFSKHERLQCWVHRGSCNNSNRLRGELIAERKISRQERP